MRFVIFLGAILFSSIAFGAEHPPWANLAKLKGLSKDSAEVVAFVRAHGLKETTKGPSGSFYPDDHAYTILYRDGRVQTIVLKVSPPPGGFTEKTWRSYSSTLPYKLEAEDGPSEVVQKLGQPTKRDGDTWHHEGRVIWVFFKEKESGINELYISPLELERKEKRQNHIEN
jgi:hypothetical protein